MLALLFCSEFLLHIPYWLKKKKIRWSFSYTFRAGFIFICVVSLKYPLLTSFLCSEFYLTHPMLTFFMWGVSVTHPVLSSFLSKEFVLHILCFLFWGGGGVGVGGGLSLKHTVLVFIFIYILFLFLFFIVGGSLTHPVLASFLCGEFLLHIPRWLDVYLGSFSDTSRAGFIFYFILIWGVSLTHPMLVSFLSGSFTYTPRAGFIFIWGVSLTCRLTRLTFLCGVSLTHPM